MLWPDSGEGSHHQMFGGRDGINKDTIFSEKSFGPQHQSIAAVPAVGGFVLPASR
jgi:hypothetical protein